MIVNRKSSKHKSNNVILSNNKRKHSCFKSVFCSYRTIWYNSICKCVVSLFAIIFSFLLVSCNGANSVNQASDISYHNKTLITFLKDTNENPKIMYFADKISKNAHVTEAYVFKDEKCRKYRCDYTLGELAKLTDLEIIKALDKEYETGLAEAKKDWLCDEATFTESLNRNVKLYEPIYYDFDGLLFTDDSGNCVKNEMLALPKAGIDDNPYVIHYPEFEEYEYSFLNYHNSNYDSSSNYKIKFKAEYFNTGHGTKSDINSINDLFCISNNGIITKNVYESLYYGFVCSNNEWTSNKGILCLRDENSNALDLQLDNLSSDDIKYVDPTENEMLSISNNCFNNYYDSFDILTIKFNELFNGKIKCGTYADSAPFEYVLNNKLVGFDIELIDLIQQKIDCKFEFVKVDTFDEIFTTMDSGEYDVIISGMSKTEERSSKYFVSKPYYICTHNDEEFVEEFVLYSTNGTIISAVNYALDQILDTNEYNNLLLKYNLNAR